MAIDVAGMAAVTAAAVVTHDCDGNALSVDGGTGYLVNGDQAYEVSLAKTVVTNGTGGVYEWRWALTITSHHAEDKVCKCPWIRGLVPHLVDGSPAVMGKIWWGRGDRWHKAANPQMGAGVAELNTNGGQQLRLGAFAFTNADDDDGETVYTIGVGFLSGKHTGFELNSTLGGGRQILIRPTCTFPATAGSRVVPEEMLLPGVPRTYVLTIRAVPGSGLAASREAMLPFLDWFHETYPNPHPEQAVVEPGDRIFVTNFSRQEDGDPDHRYYIDLAGQKRADECTGWFEALDLALTGEVGGYTGLPVTAAEAAAYLIARGVRIFMVRGAEGLRNDGHDLYPTTLSALPENLATTLGSGEIAAWRTARGMGVGLYIGSVGLVVDPEDDFEAAVEDAIDAGGYSNASGDVYPQLTNEADSVALYDAKTEADGFFAANLGVAISTFDLSVWDATREPGTDTWFDAVMQTYLAQAASKTAQGGHAIYGETPKCMTSMRYGFGYYHLQVVPYVGRCHMCDWLADPLRIGRRRLMLVQCGNQADVEAAELAGNAVVLFNLALADVPPPADGPTFNMDEWAGQYPFAVMGGGGDGGGVAIVEAGPGGEAITSVLSAAGKIEDAGGGDAAWDDVLEAIAVGGGSHAVCELAAGETSGTLRWSRFRFDLSGVPFGARLIGARVTVVTQKLSGAGELEIASVVLKGFAEGGGNITLFAGGEDGAVPDSLGEVVFGSLAGLPAGVVGGGGDRLLRGGTDGLSVEVSLAEVGEGAAATVTVGGIVLETKWQGGVGGRSRVRRPRA